MYGQTTAGKTYTMLGSPDAPGVLPCAIKDVFSIVQLDQTSEYKIWVSYLEIYNEQIHDLLVQGSTNLKINKD
jgi:centromeric protein E